MVDSVTADALTARLFCVAHMLATYMAWMVVRHDRNNALGPRIGQIGEDAPRYRHHRAAAGPQNVRGQQRAARQRVLRRRDGILDDEIGECVINMFIGHN